MNPYVSPLGSPSQPVAPARGPVAPTTVPTRGPVAPTDRSTGGLTGNAALGRVPEWAPVGGVESVNLPGQEQETDMVYVKRMYKEILNREPDLEGYAAHCVALATGATRKQVREAFLNSDEFKQLQVTGGAGPALPGGVPAVPGALPGAPGAAPAGTAKSTSVGPVPLEGYDHNKLHNMAHRTTKYLFGRIASHYPLDQVKDHAGAEALLKQMRPELEAAGLKIMDVQKDKILVVTEIGPEWVDVVRGAGGGNPGWWWGSEGKRAPGVAWDGQVPNYGGGPGGTAPAPGGRSPAPAPGGGNYASAPIDKSSVNAALQSTAEYIKNTRPDLFTQGDDRPLAYKMMTEVIKCLRANGFEAYRIVNHPSLPKDNPHRYGSDALVLNGEVYDVYGALGEANRPQVLHHGKMSGKQSQEWED